MELERSLPCSQGPIIAPFPDLDKFRPHPHSALLWEPFILLSRLRLGLTSGVFPS